MTGLLFETHMGTAEAAKTLGVHQNTIARWVRDGLMRPTYKGPGKTGTYVFTEAEVQRARRNIRRRRQKAA